MDNLLIKQTENAFGFIQNLYLEVSYLIKEIEGQLQLDEEKFQILRPSGYGVTTRSSTGLDPANVEQWLTKSLTVFFCTEPGTEVQGGQTITGFVPELKILFLNIRLVGKNIVEPQINYGYIENIVSKKPDFKKFEKLAFEFSYNEDKIFKNSTNIHYESNYCTFEGKTESVPMYAIGNSDDVNSKIVEPILKLYRSIKL